MDQYIPWFIVLVYWLGCALVTTYVADEKGRHPFSWFVIALILNVYALLAVIGLPAREKKK